ERSSEPGWCQRARDLAEHPLQHLRAQTLPCPGERRPVRNRITHARYCADQVLRHVVVGILVEQGQPQHEVHHRLRGQRTRPFAPPPLRTARPRPPLGRPPPCQRPQPHLIR